jgi:hypothetical protein
MNKNLVLMILTIIIINNIIISIGLFLAHRKAKSYFDILKDHILQIKLDKYVTEDTRYDIFKNIDGLYTNKKGGGGNIGANKRK